MASGSINKKNKKTIPDIERIIPDQIPVYAHRLLKEHVMRYSFATPYIRNKVVLDVACGSGYGAYLLANKGATKVYAIDRDLKTIQYAQQRYAHSRIRYQRASASHIPILTNSVDIITSFETIEHLRNGSQFLRELKRVLRPNGLAIISTPNKTYSIEDNPFHYREYTAREFYMVLNKFFPGNIILYGQRPVCKPLIKFYRYIKFFMTISLQPFLHMRPWESLVIEKMNSIEKDGYVYMIALCQNT